jgi:hypothetical protein
MKEIAQIVSTFRVLEGNDAERPFQRCGIAKPSAITLILGHLIIGSAPSLKRRIEATSEAGRWFPVCEIDPFLLLWTNCVNFLADDRQT